MAKYILELIGRDGEYIEHLSTKYYHNPTRTTMNAFKAEIFTEDELNNIHWFQEEAREKYGTLIKVVRIL